MPKAYIPFKETNYFSELICDYLDQEDKLKPFYNRFPSLENFKFQIEEKQKSCNDSFRAVLVKELKYQYENIETSIATNDNIESLKLANTFTITTGHQLNIFTGPLYFLYKIISTINLCKQLKNEYPENNFVPIYWMATEDHDFEEINFYNFNSKKFVWNREASGAVGELNTEGLDKVYDFFSKELDSGIHADEIRNLFKKTYLENLNLADATRYLANELFGKYGLVILDANVSSLKNLFIPNIERELLENNSYSFVEKTNKEISSVASNYKVQVNPREINLFYLKENLRERIVFQDNKYKVLNTDINFTTHSLKEEIIAHPERFSPNVIMRPLYQEVILPNLCYIGGGGEIAYWFQLRQYFKAEKVTFPMLLLRNSVLLVTDKQAKKLQKLNISYEDTFLKRTDYINKKVRKISNIEIDFSPQKEQLKQQFENLYKLAEQTDKSFLGAVGAQERKQLKGLEHLEKRLLKAQKRKLEDEVNRMVTLQEELFPNQSLQERTVNFSQFYTEMGENLIQKLVKNLEPLSREFLILEL